MRILIVEDNKDAAFTLKTELETHSFAVDMAHDGEQGSYLARVNPYDLIILDYNMPKKDGLTLCAELRKAGKTMPIIMTSVKSEVGDKIKLLNAGADDYLTKPFSFPELMARIRALLRRPTSVHGPVLTIADVVLDTAKQKVTRGGEEIYLTRKEFALLEYLMRNQGTVLSRGEILEHVWDAESDPFSNTIEAHILHLRRKIDTGHKIKVIQTIPTRGYKVDIAQ